MKRYFIALLTILLLAGCAPASPPVEDVSPSPPSPPEEDQTVFAPVEFSEPESDPDPRQEAIDKLLASMTEEEKIGQLFFARCPSQRGAELAAEYHLGGYLLFTRDFKDAAGNWLTEEQFTETIQSYQNASAIPMLIGVDEEGGTVVRASRNPNLFDQMYKSPQWLSSHSNDQDNIFAEDAREKNRKLLSLGINVNLAPVCDVSTNPKSFIYDRTLGQDAAATSGYVQSVVTAMRDSGIGSVLKHFPGYGDNADTHTGTAIDDRPLDSFRASDFLPFQAGIEAGGGTSAVLVSHNTVNCMDPDRPASLSPAVYQILRKELGFDGPAITDDLAMDAITKFAKGQEQSPAVLALAAGCDMVLTTDFQTQTVAVQAALEDGTISQARIDEAVSRVLGWKYDLGLLT